MKIEGKEVLLFPEYHLTDFPPQISISKDIAVDLVKPYQMLNADLLIVGYVECLKEILL